MAVGAIEIENLLAVGRARRSNRLRRRRNGARRFADKAVQTFRELNVVSQLVDKFCMREGFISSPAIRLGEMHTGGLQLICERREVLYLQANAGQRAAF